MKCPKCESTNIYQDIDPIGPKYCEDCGFYVPCKEKYDPFIEKEKFEDIVKEANKDLYQNLTINKIEQIRAKNNGQWMDLVRIALKYAPEKTKEVLKKITNHDKEVTSLIERLSK